MPGATGASTEVNVGTKVKVGTKRGHDTVSFDAVLFDVVRIEAILR